MKKAFKILGYSILGFVAFVGLYMLAAYGLSKIGSKYEQPTSKDVTIYISTNGVHTDVVLPIKNEVMDWTRLMKFENTKGQDTLASYIAMGWGDKGFYLNTPTWADLKFSTAFNAAFALSTSAIHTTFYKKMDENETCKRIDISKEQYERLVNYVKKSLDFDANGNTFFIKTDAVYGKDDAFYEAGGSYHMFHTCNTWSNNALKSCGQKAAFWTPFDEGIFYHYQ
jgi:uncharacterized protein (TIGR02117 family)